MTSTPILLPRACGLFCHTADVQLMNVGLLYTPVSIYQMTRGALVLFVGVLSVIFLRRRLWRYQLSFLPCFPPIVLHLAWPSVLRTLARKKMLTLVPKMDIPYNRHGRCLSRRP